VKEKIKKGLFALLRLTIGIGIVAFLVVKINSGTRLVEFQVPGTTIAKGALYKDDNRENRRFLAIDALEDGTVLRALVVGTSKEPIGETGLLVLQEGNGPQQVPWTARTVRPYGLPILRNSFLVAGKNWYYLVAALACFFGCLSLCAVRWKFILAARGLQLTWQQTLAIFFIGHFFNAFMFGSTGGDVLKAYYASARTGHRKAEAVSTVFIDRVMGLLAMIVLTSVTMLVRMKFFLADYRTRAALFFMLWVAGFAIMVFAMMFAMRRLTERSQLFRRGMQTRIGHIFYRVYNSFYLCLTHPALLAKTLTLSLMNQVLILVLMWVLGLSLEINAGFFDYFSLGPTINTFAAIPLTPGGVGLREFAAIMFLGIIGVPATQALPLSVLTYATMLTWSIFGGIVFFFYTGSTRHHLPAEAIEMAEHDSLLGEEDPDRSDQADPSDSPTTGQPAC